MFLSDRRHYKKAIELFELGDIEGALEHLKEISNREKKGRLFVKIVEETAADIPQAVKLIVDASKLGIDEEYLRKAREAVLSELVRTAQYPEKAYVGVPVRITFGIPVREDAGNGK